MPFFKPLENGLLFAAKRLGDGRLRSEVLEEVLRCHATIFGVPIIEVKRISENIFGFPIDFVYRRSDTSVHALHIAANGPDRIGVIRGNQ